MHRGLILPLAMIAVLAGTPAWAEAPAPATTGKTIEQWLQQLKSTDASQRRQAAVSLGSYGPDMPKTSIQALGVLLQDNDATVRHAVALSLGNSPKLQKWRWRPGPRSPRSIP